MSADPNVYGVVKAMAQGKLPDCDGSEYCLYCDASPYDPHNDKIYIDMVHRKECPITIARSLMRDWGMPLNIYQITHERIQEWTNIGWHQIKACHTGFTAEEVSQEWGPREANRMRYRNVEVEFVRQFPFWEYDMLTTSTKKEQ